MICYSDNPKDDCTSKEDLSGKEGKCSLNGHDKTQLGTEDDLKNYDPATNPRIAQFTCARALAANNLGDDGYSADLKLCEADK